MCPGGQLNLTCLAAPGEILLQRSLTISENNVSVFAVGQTTFRFLKTSTSPLTSLTIINNVAVELNGTQVQCSYDNVMVSTILILLMSSEMVCTDPPVVCVLCFNP